MDWDLYRTFLEVRRQRGLSGAARALGTTHPTVGRQVAALEALLGGRLFTRSTQGLVPTALADRIAPDAEAMEARAYAIRRTASAVSEEVAGRVRLSASHVMAIEVLPSMLQAIQSRHPRLDFELSVSDDNAGVMRRDADIAVRMARPSGDGLIARRVGTIAVGLYAHADWLRRREAPERVEDLLRDGVLVWQDRQTGFASALGLSAAAIQAASSFASDSDLAQLAAVRAGLGVGVVQLPLAARDAMLRRVLPGLEVGLELWLVTHPDLRASPPIRAVLDGLVAALDRYVRSGDRQRPRDGGG